MVLPRFTSAIFMYEIQFAISFHDSLYRAIDARIILHDKSSTMRILEDRAGHSSRVHRHFRCAWCKSVMSGVSLASAAKENYGMCSVCLTEALKQVAPACRLARPKDVAKGESSPLALTLSP